MPVRKKREIKIVAELLPPQPRTPKTDLEALERLVAEKVHEILADRDDLLMQPFFSSRSVSHELRRLQTVPEQRKWAHYFEKWGCLICETKCESYYGCGMCTSCYQRTNQRLHGILKEQMRERIRHRFTGNLEAIAKKALLKPLPEKQKQGYGRETRQDREGN